MRNEGLRALFRGLESTLWRDVPFSAFYWLGVEAVRDSLLRRGRGVSLLGLLFSPLNPVGFLRDSTYRSPLVALLASSTAGAAAAFVTTPFDVVKTRRQVQAIPKESARQGFLPFAGSFFEAFHAGLSQRSLWRDLLSLARSEGGCSGRDVWGAVQCVQVSGPCSRAALLVWHGWLQPAGHLGRAIQSLKCHGNGKTAGSIMLGTRTQRRF